MPSYHLKQSDRYATPSLNYFLYSPIIIIIIIIIIINCVYIPELHWSTSFFEEMQFVSCDVHSISNYFLMGRKFICFVKYKLNANLLWNIL
jgi:hypothetical protein